MPRVTSDARRRTPEHPRLPHSPRWPPSPRRNTVRAVVDTKVLASGLLGVNAPPWQVVMAIATDRIRPVVCAEMVAEYRDVLARPRLRIRPDRALRPDRSNPPRSLR